MAAVPGTFNPKVGTFVTLGKASGVRLSEHITLHWVLGLRRNLDSNTNNPELGVTTPLDHGVVGSDRSESAPKVY